VLLQLLLTSNKHRNKANGYESHTKSVRTRSTALRVVTSLGSADQPKAYD
jgi:hypothetical protein